MSGEGFTYFQTFWAIEIIHPGTNCWVEEPMSAFPGTTERGRRHLYDSKALALSDLWRFRSNANIKPKLWKIHQKKTITRKWKNK